MNHDDNIMYLIIFQLMLTGVYFVLIYLWVVIVQCWNRLWLDLRIIGFLRLYLKIACICQYTWYVNKVNKRIQKSVMNISLDQEIRKDKQKEQSTRNYQYRTYNNNNPHHKARNHHDRNSRYGYQGNPNRERERQLRVFVNISNLHYSVTREQLQEICERYGRVKSCRIQWDKMGRSNEKATVEYFNRADSQHAVQKLKGTILEEQAIEVELAEEQHNPPKKHEIRKNYSHRFRQFSNNNGKNGYRNK